MGCSISWIAVAGKSKTEVLAALALLDTGEPDQENDSPVSGAELPGGWYLLYLKNIVHPFTHATALRKLSAGGKALVCQVEEHVMASSAFMYENGVKIWAVTHQSEHDIYHLAIEGNPPSALNTIHAEMKADQDIEGGQDADVDYLFDVPSMVAATVCGYRYDCVTVASGEKVSFTRLVAASA